MPFLKYISAVKCLQSRLTFKLCAILAIQLRFDDFQALHIQAADRVYLTLSANKFCDVNHIYISHRDISYTGTDIFYVSTKKCCEQNVGNKGATPSP